MPNKDVDLFKTLIWDNLVKVGIARVVLLAPFLGWPIIGPVFSWIAIYFADQLYVSVKLAINLELIVLQNEVFRKQFNDASVNLKSISDLSGPDSKEFKEARDGHAKSLSRFVRFSM